MKLYGKKIEGSNVEIIVLPRGNGESIVFKAQAVLSYENFEKICPPPIPPKITRRSDGQTVDDLEDKNYLAALKNHINLQTTWMILQSLKATETLEWETVQYEDPNTWQNYIKELTDAGFSEREKILIIQGITSANSLNEAKVEEARKRFFMMEQLKKQESLSQEAEQKNTQSGEPANA